MQTKIHGSSNWNKSWSGEIKMKCKNLHCQWKQFVAVIEENQTLVGVKCVNCSARYSMDELEILKSVKREGYWNSVKWGIKKF